MNFEFAGAATPSLPLPNIMRSIGYYLHPSVPVASLRYILHGGSGSEEDQFMIGFIWLAAEIVAMMIFVLFAVLYASQGPDVLKVYSEFIFESCLRDRQRRGRQGPVEHTWLSITFIVVINIIIFVISLIVVMIMIMIFSHFFREVLLQNSAH